MDHQGRRYSPGARGGSPAGSVDSTFHVRYTGVSGEGMAGDREGVSYPYSGTPYTGRQHAQGQDAYRRVDDVQQWNERSDRSRVGEAGLYPGHETRVSDEVPNGGHRSGVRPAERWDPVSTGPPRNLGRVTTVSGSSSVRSGSSSPASWSDLSARSPSVSRSSRSSETGSSLGSSARRSSLMSTNQDYSSASSYTQGSNRSVHSASSGSWISEEDASSEYVPSRSGSSVYGADGSYRGSRRSESSSTSRQGHEIEHFMPMATIAEDPGQALSYSLQQFAGDFTRDGESAFITRRRQARDLQLIDDMLDRHGLGRRG